MSEGPQLVVPGYISRLAKIFSQPPAQASLTASPDDESVIKVNDVVGKVALLYEKLRNVVDYNDEHLLRKNAIFRILKRLVFIEKKRQGLGLLLIQELVRANYLPNNAIPESQAVEVDNALLKYLFIIDTIFVGYRNKPRQIANRDLLQIAACQIEEVLFDFSQRAALQEVMQRVLGRDISLPASLSVDDQEILLLVTTLRSLIKSDESIIYYNLLKRFNPNFFSPTVSQADLTAVGSQFGAFRARVSSYLDHPLKYKLLKIGKKYSVYFAILRDVLEENREQISQIMTHPKMLEEEIIQVCDKRYRQVRTKVVRSVVRSIIYIFLTKMLLALLVEVPLDLWWESRIDYFALSINILFPPVLMALVSLMIRLPKHNNTEKIVERLKNIVYKPEREEKRYVIKKISSRSTLTNFFFNLFYFLTYGLSFGLIVWFLYMLNFNAISGIIFIFFLSIVSFFAIRIRLAARELVVVDRKEGLINFLFDFLTLPVVRLGRWLSVKLSRINIFVFFLDLFVEAPFKLFMALAEEWFSFIREKKEEIY